MSPTNANSSTPVARSRLKSRRRSGLDLRNSPGTSLCDPASRLKLNPQESPPKRPKLMNVVKVRIVFLRVSVSVCHNVILYSGFY